MALAKLLRLGEMTHLAGKAGNVEISSLEGRVVLLYFGASWCPPCRAFTPHFISFYKSMKEQGKDVEVIYVSQDKDERSFDEYTKEHPWLKIPWVGTEKRRRILTNRARVHSFPTVAIVNTIGAVASLKGREKIMQDPKGKDYPWVPPNILTTLGEVSIFHPLEAGRTIRKPELDRHEYIGIYFGSLSVTPCRMFEPRLALIYRKLKERGINFEFITFPLDSDGEQLKEHITELPWPCITLRDPNGQKLIEACGVEQMPALTIVTRGGALVNVDARALADEDSEGVNFPWSSQRLPCPTPLLPSTAVVEALNNAVCIIFTKNKSQTTTGEQEFMKAAARLDLELNATLPDDAKVRFFFVDGPEGESIFQQGLSAFGASTPRHGESAIFLASMLNENHTFLTGDIGEEAIVTGVRAFYEANK